MNTNDFFCCYIKVITTKVETLELRLGWVETLLAASDSKRFLNIFMHLCAGDCYCFMPLYWLVSFYVHDIEYNHFIKVWNKQKLSTLLDFMKALDQSTLLKRHLKFTWEILDCIKDVLFIQAFYQNIILFIKDTRKKSFFEQHMDFLANIWHLIIIINPLKWIERKINKMMFKCF